MFLTFRSGPPFFVLFFLGYSVGAVVAAGVAALFHNSFGLPLCH
jgi:thioesterase domain-containing protein